MNGTDELRGFANSGMSAMECSAYSDKLIALADRIDAEHQKALDEWKAEHGQMWLKGYAECHAELLEGNETLASDLERCGWIRLPVDGEAPCKQLGEWIEKRGLITGPLDHDGELWHNGDMSASPWGVIEGIVFENGKWSIRGHDTSAPWLPADSLLHYHAPTVEDVLREFANEVYADADNEIRDRDFLCAKYAKRLTLAEGEDA